MLGSSRMRVRALAVAVGVAVAVAVTVAAVAVAGAAASSAARRQQATGAARRRQATGAARRRQATGAAKIISLQPSYDAHGDPSLLGQAAIGNRPLSLHWRACLVSGGSACRPLHAKPLGHGTGASVLTPGRTQPGTFFEVVVRARGRQYIARSATWLGTVGATRPPTLTGAVRAGAHVTPRRARWSGGWSRAIATFGLPPSRHPNTDELNVEACRTSTARHCVNLTPQGGGRQFRRGASQVPDRYRGWYLFAFDQRIAQPELLAEPGYRTPEEIPVVKTVRTVARSAPYGPITAR